MDVLGDWCLEVRLASSTMAIAAPGHSAAAGATARLEMAGWLRVDRTAEADDIEVWVERGVSFARSLPPK